jgi:hypothetical protein
MPAGKNWNRANARHQPPALSEPAPLQDAQTSKTPLDADWQRSAYPVPSHSKKRSDQQKNQQSTVTVRPY